MAFWQVAAMAFNVASSVAKAGAAVAEGDAQLQDAKYRAKQAEIQGIQDEAIAISNMVLRVDEYEQALDTNDAYFSSYLGRDDASVEARFEGDKKVLVKDLSFAQKNLTQTRSRAKITSLMEIQRGRNAQRASYAEGVGHLVSAAGSYATYRAK